MKTGGSRSLADNLPRHQMAGRVLRHAELDPLTGVDSLVGVVVLA